MNLAFDADIVLLLYRERKAEEQADGTAEVLSDQATLYVEKNRNGPTGLVKLYFHSGYVRFDETI
jgi:replicative DNA helicase